MAGALEIDLWDLSLPQQEEAAYASNPRTIAALRSWDLTATALGVLLNLQALRFVTREQVYDSWRIRWIMVVQMAHVAALLLAPGLCSRQRTKISLLNRCIRLAEVVEGLWPSTGPSGKPSPTNALMYRSVETFTQSATGVRTTTMTLLVLPVRAAGRGASALRACPTAAPCARLGAPASQRR
jgi:hypothetical protein